jgi:hypothetical protein
VRAVARARVRLRAEIPKADERTPNGDCVIASVGKDVAACVQVCPLWVECECVHVSVQV